jgi:hypothetical protein
MRIKLSDLRRIIREEVERNLRWTAGFFGGNLSQPSTLHTPLPGLGVTVEKDNDYNNREHEEEEISTEIEPQ